VETLRVLVVEDSEDDAALLIRELRRGGYRPVFERVETAAAMKAALEAHRWDVVIADYALPGFSAPAALSILKSEGLDLPFIIVSGTIGEDTAVAAMKAGAHDYLMKGNLARLIPAIQRELREARERWQRGVAETELAHERDYSRLLIEGANALIIGLDLEGRITVFNRAAETVTGYRREDAIGRYCGEVLAPDGRFTEVCSPLLSFRTTGRPDDFEATIATVSGDERVIAWRNSLLRAGDRVIGTISFGIDVTDRKRAERERVAMEQLARRTEKLAALGTLAAGLAHELNNPIGIMSSRIELMLLEGSHLPAALREDLVVLHRNAQRVARIASGLLSFARQSSGERMPVDLNHVVSETLLLAEKQLTKEGIRVVTTLAPRLPAILGDANTLQQVLLNLITNAWDALPRGGELRIETNSVVDKPRTVRLVIADTGQGIAPEVLPRIFDPFFSTKASGTGLGLSITDGIVREHGGTIDVESSPGKGTRFVLTFPVATPSATPSEVSGA
jgi:two-component system, cell cycle sensor histidine kinase and response regulator CckA